MSNAADAFPYLTSNDTTGDLPTAGFNADALAGQLVDPDVNDTNTYGGAGLTSPGVDTFFGIDHVHPEHIPQLPDVLDEALKNETTTGRRQVERTLQRIATYGDAPFVRTKTPDVAGTGAVFLAAPGATSQAAPILLLSADPQRYRVTLHQYPGQQNAANPDWQLWIGQTQAQAVPFVGFPLPQTGPVSFFWGDDLWVGVSSPQATSPSGAAYTAPTSTGTWCYFTVERYR